MLKGQGVFLLGNIFMIKYKRERSAMKKRLWFLMPVLALVLLLILAPILITLIFFRAYIGLGIGLSLFLVGGFQMFIGIYQRNLAKRSGELLPRWWRYSPTVMPLVFVCFGMLEWFAVLFNSNPSINKFFESNLGETFFGFLILLIISISIYGVILSGQYAIAQYQKAQVLRQQAQNMRAQHLEKSTQPRDVQ